MHRLLRKCVEMRNYKYKSLRSVQKHSMTTRQMQKRDFKKLGVTGALGSQGIINRLSFTHVFLFISIFLCLVIMSS